MSSYIIQQIINGIQLGSMYALIALGYSMVYGIIKLINFAHADIFMLGAYVAFFIVAFYSGAAGTLPPTVWLWIALLIGYLLYSMSVDKVDVLKRIMKTLDDQSRNGPWHLRIRNIVIRFSVSLGGIILFSALAFPVVYFPTRVLFRIHLSWILLPVTLCYVMIICAIFGTVMERVAYRPLRYKPRLSALITALGVSLFLENFSSLKLAFDTLYRPFPEIIKKADVLHVPGTNVGITNIFFVNSITVIILLIGLWFLVEKTLIGKQMRAVSYDIKTASLMGIDVNRVIAFTFAVGPALAGVAGVLYGMNYGILQSPFLGFYPGIKAFIAAVLGGIGSLPGAVIGALVMGLTEVFANSVDSNLGFAAAFVILIVILLIRPNGLMGKRDIEKV
jgi:branched-chain amino acid transport system permease protein